MSHTNACTDWPEARVRGPPLGCLSRGEARYLRAGTVQGTRPWALGVDWSHADACVKEGKGWQGLRGALTRPLIGPCSVGSRLVSLGGDFGWFFWDF